MSRGKRDSEWLVIRRCLAMVRRVQRGPTDWRGLVEAVQTAVPDGYGEISEKALRSRVHKDLNRIRSGLNIKLRADPKSKLYSILDIDQPLLDLPDDDLATIAWLEQNFGPGTPQHEKIQALLERLRFYLAPQRRLEIEKQRTTLVLELGQQDDDRIDPEIELKLQEALARRRRVEFDYLSPQNESGQPRRHVVDVFEPPRFEASLGHYYLRGWCHYSSGVGGRFEAGHYIPYRLGRITNLKPLPQKLPPEPPTSKKYRVEYKLSARIARQGVTRRRWIDFERTEKEDGDRVVVYGTTDSPFFALLELMHYRHHCRVRGGPELLKMMKETVQEMSGIYEKGE